MPSFVGPWMISAAFTMGAAGAAANAATARHIWTHFDVGSSAVFLLALVDSAVSVAGSLAYPAALAATTAAATSGERLVCSLPIILCYLNSYTGTLLTAEVAVIRLHTVKLSRKNIAAPEARFRRVSLSLLLASLLYFFCLYGWVLYTALPQSHLAQECAGDDEDVFNNRTTVVNFFLGLPILVSCLVSLFADALMICLVRNMFDFAWVDPAAPPDDVEMQEAAGNNEDASSADKASTDKSLKYNIPVQATVLSIGLILVYPLFPLVPAGLGASIELQAQIIVVACVVLIAARSPLTMALTFSEKSRADEESAKKKTRKALLERELYFAKAAREERLNGGSRTPDAISAIFRGRGNYHGDDVIVV